MCPPILNFLPPPSLPHSSTIPALLIKNVSIWTAVCVYVCCIPVYPGGASGKEPTCQCRSHKETWVQFLGVEDPLEEGMATHSSINAWRIPWREESMSSQRVGHN